MSSQSELDAIVAEEKELLQKLEEKRRIRVSIEDELKKADSYNLLVTRVDVTLPHQFISVQTKYNPELVDIMHNIPGRDYFAGVNKIPLKEWAPFLEKIAKNPRFVLTFSNGCKEEIDALYVINQEKEKELAKLPDVVITLTNDKRFLKVICKPTHVSQVAIDIQGARYNNYQNQVLIPTSEGYKLYQNVSHIEKVDWDDESRKMVLDQIELKTKLDDIALKHDSEITALLDLRGFIPRPFQNVGIEFIDSVTKDGGGVILADQMGLGKSAQAIILCMINKWRALIVPPATLKMNWMKEIRKITGADAEVFSGRVPSKQDMERLLVDTEKKQWNIINYDALSGSVKSKKDFSTVESAIRETENHFIWADIMNLSKFDIIIFDESHYIKNVDSKRSQVTRKLSCRRYLCLTGTPVLNRPGELWPMLTLIKPELFPTYEGFLKTYTVNGKDAKNVAQLRDMLKGLMIRRTKSEVMKDLPPINRIEESHELSEKAQYLYRKVEDGIYNELMAWGEDVEGAEEAIPNLLVKIMRMKQICAIDKLDHTAEIAVNLSDSSDEDKNKVIIFTQFKPIAYGLHKRFGDEGLVMTGDMNMNEREHIKKQFIEDPSKKFLVGMWQVLGEGHNLEVAWNVVFNDLFWTPANHAQCEERAYGRLSNAHHIDSYWMVANQQGGGETIENWIKALLAQKMNVINETVEGLSVDRSKSILKELLVKMKKELRR